MNLRYFLYDLRLGTLGIEFARVEEPFTGMNPACYIFIGQAEAYFNQFLTFSITNFETMKILKTLISKLFNFRRATLYPPHGPGVKNSQKSRFFE